MASNNYWDQFWRKRLSRRTLLRTGAVGTAGLVSAIAVGCGEEEKPAATATPAAGTPAAGTPTAGAQVADYTQSHPWLGTKEGVPRRGGVYMTAQQSDPLDLNIIGRDAPEAFTLIPVYDTLIMSIEPEKLGVQKMYPNLAQKWEQPDNVTYILKLQPGVKFHNVAPANGREFDSEDVEVNIKHAVTPGQYGSTLRDYYNLITRFERPDKHTIKLTTSEPFADQLYNLSFVRFVQMPRELIETQQFVTKAVGTGAFLFDKWDKGVGYSAKRNPDYWKKGLPYLDGFVHLTVPDRAARMAQFQAREVEAWGGIAKEAETVKGTNPDAIYEERATMVVNRVKFDVQGSVFKDKRLRQAILYGTDYDLFIQLAHGGKAVQAWFWPPEWQPWALQKADLPKTDVAKAKALLAEAGYGPDKPLKVVSTDTLNYGASIYGPPLIGMWKELGIEVEQKFVDNAQWIAEIDDAGVKVMTIHADYAWDTPSRNLYSEFHTDGEGNNTNYSNKQLDPILVQVRTEMNLEKRVQLAKQAQKMIIDDAPHVHLASYFSLSFRQPWVRGYFPQMGGNFAGYYDRIWLWVTDKAPKRSML